MAGNTSRRVGHWATGTSLLAALGLATPPVAHAAAPASGFIVQLRDAPAHLRTLPGDSSGTQADSQAQAVQQQRWARLLKEARRTPAAQPLSLRPVGRAAQRLSWSRPLSASEQQRWLATLSARPEVAWVVADSREPALQTLVTPNDPSFASGDASQWWLQQPSGSNSAALPDRRRGVAGLQAAWFRSTGSAQTVVAVLDTGLTTHPDLDSQRLLPGYDMVSDWSDAQHLGYANDGDGRDGDPADPGDGVSQNDTLRDASRYGGCAVQSSTWHGTTVTGLIAATSQNALGVAGANWGTRILPVRVAGQCGASVSDIVDGMRWAAGLSVCKRWSDSQDPLTGCAEWAPINPTPAQIINISFGGNAACSAAYQTAIDELWDLGILVVAAAGNDSASPSRPANCAHVLGVAAANRDGFKASYSNFGTSVGLLATGGDSGGRWGPWLADGGLLTLGNDGSQAPGEPIYNHHSGTSFAAPVVSSVAALMLGLDPTLQAAHLVQGLQASARPHVQSPSLATCSASAPGRCACTSDTCGTGLLDADQALQFAQLHAQGLSYVAPAWAPVVIDTQELRDATATGPDREAPANTTDPGTNASPSGGGSMGHVPYGLLLVVAGLALKGRRTATNRPAPGSPG